MHVQDLIARRYSCRTYQDKPVEREKLIALVEAARNAPSACNSQRWTFIVVDEEESRKKLAEALYNPEFKGNAHAKKTPAFIVLVRTQVKEFLPHQKLIIGKGEYWDIDIGIAAENISLLATEMGLGSVIMSWFTPEKVEEAMEVPEDMSVALVIGLGYPQGDMPPRQRKELDEVIRFNSFNGTK